MKSAKKTEFKTASMVANPRHAFPRHAFALNRLAILDARLGKGIGAMKERARLNAILAK